jgi:hypothetical protein
MLGAETGLDFLFTITVEILNAFIIYTCKLVNRQIQNNAIETAYSFSNQSESINFI